MYGQFKPARVILSVTHSFPWSAPPPLSPAPCRHSDKSCSASAQPPAGRESRRACALLPARAGGHVVNQGRQLAPCLVGVAGPLRRCRHRGPQSSPARSSQVSYRCRSAPGPCPPVTARDPPLPAAEITRCHGGDARRGGAQDPLSSPHDKTQGGRRAGMERAAHAAARSENTGHVLCLLACHDGTEGRCDPESVPAWRQ